eukprot:TRINITY_DN7265_c3_g1_i1.p1 TRINITY_DN7265_c3_g1~~TRINITY_DN7265_c3_g1_i1.p1  ORF type:complete len:297 (+),score=46.36 TRINITY_DN7265_c3_g1_i1:83-973(+)
MSEPRQAKKSTLSRLMRYLLVATGLWQFFSSGAVSAFVPGYHRIARAPNRDASKTRRNFFGGDDEEEKEKKRNPVTIMEKSAKQEMIEAKKEFFDKLVPPETRYEVVDGGNILRERFKGARDFAAGFWAITGISFGFGFFVVGISAFFDEPVVDWNPITAQYLPFLRPMEGINWVPQGAFMTFWGTIGFFFLGPWFLWCCITNAGQGVMQWNKKTQKMTLVKDDTLERDIDFDQIEKVKLEWSNSSFLGRREVLVVLQDQREVRWMNEEYPKVILENRASTLAAFLDKELVTDEYL